jgi:pimeloyl-ACP methyl ester carboxylesterase
VTVYSYRGLDSTGNPLPYEPEATHQSVDASAALLAEQVKRVHQRTGKPVALVGLSEGALVTRKYLAAWPHADVDAAALVSPVVRPGQIYYPPPEANHGWGLVAGWELRGVMAIVELHHTTPITADEPFVRSVFANAPLFRNQMLCSVPGVRMLAFLPSADAATIPPGGYRGIPADNLPSLHGGLLGEPAEQQRLVTFLNGGEVNGRQRRYYSLVQQASGVWQAPVLALRVNPAWRAPNQPDAAFYGDACPANR